MEKVVPIEESLSLKEAKLSFSNLQTLGGPEGGLLDLVKTVGWRDLLSLPRTGEWPVARLVIKSSLNMPINFYSVKREALTMPVNCKVDLSYNRNMTRSLSTVQQCEGKLFPLYNWLSQVCFLKNRKSKCSGLNTCSTLTWFEWFSLLAL